MCADGEGQDHLVPPNASRIGWCRQGRGVFRSGGLPRGILGVREVCTLLCVWGWQMGTSVLLEEVVADF